jgi:hypothetical protein
MGTAGFVSKERSGLDSVCGYARLFPADVRLTGLLLLDSWFIEDKSGDSVGNNCRHNRKRSREAGRRHNRRIYLSSENGLADDMFYRVTERPYVSPNVSPTLVKRL